jgi:hypothetical protein
MRRLIVSSLVVFLMALEMVLTVVDLVPDVGTEAPLASSTTLAGR